MMTSHQCLSPFLLYDRTGAAVASTEPNPVASETTGAVTDATVSSGAGAAAALVGAVSAQ